MVAGLEKFVQHCGSQHYYYFVAWRCKVGLDLGLGMGIVTHGPLGLWSSIRLLHNIFRHETQMGYNGAGSIGINIHDPKPI